MGCHINQKPEMKHNINRYKQLAQEYSQKDFIKVVENFLGWEVDAEN